MVSLIQTALELGLICSLTVLALFLSYSMLNVCDLSTDGCFTLGAAVGAVVAISGHPFLAIAAAMSAGVCSGFVTALLQTRMGVDSLLAGIIVNTGLYSINIAVMGGASLLNMNKTGTVFTMMKDLLAGTPLAGQYKLVVAVIAVALVLTALPCAWAEAPENVLKLATSAGAGDLDPAGIAIDMWTEYAKLCVDPLIRFDAEGNVVYEAALK